MSNLLSLLLYLGAGVFVVGVVFWVFRYFTTPVPLQIPVTTAPFTTIGVVFRMLREVLLFESLFKASRWTWLCGWVFHVALLFVLLCHLRFFTNPIWGWVNAIAPYSKYGGILMFAGLVGLLIRRIVVQRVRFISTPSDYLMLLLFLCLAGSGLLMRYKFYIDLYTLQQFALGLRSFSFNELPPSAMLVVHLTMVGLLLLVFPFSKLVHAIGVFFSPSRNQRDTNRKHHRIKPQKSP